eukprot:3503940-Rhodomonas_salina.1
MTSCAIVVVRASCLGEVWSLEQMSRPDDDSGRATPDSQRSDTYPAGVGRATRMQSDLASVLQPPPAPDLAQVPQQPPLPAGGPLPLVPTAIPVRREWWRGGRQPLLSRAPPSRALPSLEPRGGAPSAFLLLLWRGRCPSSSANIPST